MDGFWNRLEEVCWTGDLAIETHSVSAASSRELSSIPDSENEQTWIEADVADQGNCEALRIRRICAVVERECNCGPMRARQLRLL